MELVLPPEEAIREAILNALVHKDYESGVPVRVSVYGNRLSVDNIGSMPQSWTLEDIEGDHGSRPANPVIASALHSTGFFKGVGCGLPLIFHQCAEEGLPTPIVEMRPDETAITFFFGEKQTEAPRPAAEGIVRPHGAHEGEDRTMTDFERSSIAAANNLDMTLTDEYILRIFKKNGRATAVKIAQILGISESTVRRSFKRLIDLGFIERVGSNKTGYWKVLK